MSQFETIFNTIFSISEDPKIFWAPGFSKSVPSICHCA